MSSPIHPSGENAFSLLSLGVAIWVANVLTFSLLYWQIDQGGPYARASKSGAKPDWVFPQPAKPEDLPPDWRPLFLDYLYLGYNTATAFGHPDTSHSFAFRQDADDDRKHDLALDDGHCPVTRHQHST